MSDVSAAFDRVFVDRLVRKLAARGAPTEVLQLFRSWLGSSFSAAEFQGALQGVITDAAQAGADDWEKVFSPRVPWHRHPLRRYGVPMGGLPVGGLPVGGLLGRPPRRGCEWCWVLLVAACFLVLTYRPRRLGWDAAPARTCCGRAPRT
ncbi:unnamed protein product [Prorocentrum cordatum]|uniref:RNA-directed DNA polymerase n=1 Tax=Prorocentrum cordatum TaxID=2364126 RepID=A0ABN9TTV7_9DINO|nr:unnamed protein product [Polarella glacialis]